MKPQFYVDFSRSRTSSLRDLDYSCLHWKWRAGSPVCPCEVKELPLPTSQVLLAPCHFHSITFMLFYTNFGTLRLIYAVRTHLYFIGGKKRSLHTFLTFVINHIVYNTYLEFLIHQLCELIRTLLIWFLHISLSSALFHIQFRPDFHYFSHWLVIKL